MITRRLELKFKKEARTSRGVMTTRTSVFYAEEREAGWAIGEAAPLPGLSLESLDEVGPGTASYETASEMLARDWGDHMLWPSGFTFGTESVRINGLVWMGTTDSVEEQIRSLLNRGFRCIKMKVGAGDFQEELALIRRLAAADPQVEIRVDANGAFDVEDAPARLNALTDAGVFSIEQPIAPGQPDALARLCSDAPMKIALDEELIPIRSRSSRVTLLDRVRPAMVVLKPSLMGGFAACDEWIELAEERGIGWWVTSALESNIGLNATAQWVAAKRPTTTQGLGTGSLFEQNFQCPLRLQGEQLTFDPEGSWDLSLLNLP
ncbi:MAG: o-succinylbenzoate synthase [Fimbriimonadaceae bacterium]|nr:o-succinylbenzoate synthase [Fimbriimonadaceae bacterium]